MRFIAIAGIFTRACLQIAPGILAGSAVVPLKVDFGSLTQVLISLAPTPSCWPGDLPRARCRSAAR